MPVILLFQLFNDGLICQVEHHSHIRVRKRWSEIRSILRVWNKISYLNNFNEMRFYLELKQMCKFSHTHSQRQVVGGHVEIFDCMLGLIWADVNIKLAICKIRTWHECQTQSNWKLQKMNINFRLRITSSKLSMRKLHVNFMWHVSCLPDIENLGENGCFELGLL